MKPGLLDICVIIFSLAMAVILAFDVVALLKSRGFPQWARRGRERRKRMSHRPLGLNRRRLGRILSPNGRLSRDAYFCARKMGDKDFKRATRTGGMQFNGLHQLQELQGLVEPAGHRAAAFREGDRIDQPAFSAMGSRSPSPSRRPRTLASGRRCGNALFHLGRERDALEATFEPRALELFVDSSAICFG